jgi:P-type Na+/K+ transporter
MNRPPRNLISGVFNKEFAVDTAVYGLIMGIPPLLSFVAVVYGAGGGNLGIDCNDHMSASCNVVYRARAAVFASITIIILLHGFQMKDTRKSMFRMDLLENRTLFISVMGGCIALLPTIYIDHVNESVFKMTDISWEWGLCAASVAFYIAGVEVYKALKRRFWKCDLVG